MLNLPPRFTSPNPVERKAESSVAWIGHLSRFPLALVGLILIGMHDSFALPVYIGLWVRLGAFWMLGNGIVRGARWSWGPSVLLCSGHCVVWTLVVLAELLRLRDGSIISTGLESFWSAIGILLMATILLSPLWVFLGGASLALWHHWHEFGISKHERYRHLVHRGLPAIALSLTLDAPLIATFVGNPQVIL